MCCLQRVNRKRGRDGELRKKIESLTVIARGVGGKGVVRQAETSVARHKKDIQLQLVCPDLLPPPPPL